jgi:esterase/lipase
MKLAQRLAIGLVRVKFRVLSAFSRRRAAAYAFRLFCTPRNRTVKVLSPLFKEAETLQSDFGTYHITGYRWNKGAGRRALLLHGFESSAANFGHFVTPLIDKGYEVLAFDAPAHGRSSGKMANALIYKEFIQHIHQEYGPIESYIGHSFGGLALSLALAEIKHDDSWRAVLIAPATKTSTAIDHLFQLLGSNNKEVRKEFDQIIFELAKHPVEWFSIKRTLPQVQARILWIHDEMDNITPWRDAEEIKEENHLTIQFVITRGLGHRRIYRDAEVGKTIVYFM